VLASVDSDKRRKVWKAGNCDAEGGDGLWCARYDSRPLLKAKEPSGRAESASRRRAWRAIDAVRHAQEEGCIAITDPHRLPATKVSRRHGRDSAGLRHLVDVVRGLISRLGVLLDLEMVVSSRACGEDAAREGYLQRWAWRHFRR
jgi:hypothetical protein